jgi:imidazolonepropionase-like amidohydrolase
MIVLSNIESLYDGASADQSAVHHRVDLYVEGGRIRRLAPHDPALALGSEHRKVDCSTLTVTPGLIDCHEHVTLFGTQRLHHEIMSSPAAMLYVEKILYTTLVDGGVTTGRDVGGATHLMKRMVDSGAMLGPRLKIAISMLSSTGGHGDFLGPDRCHATLSPVWPAGPGRPSNLVDGPWECRKRVREIAGCGADLIKLCTSAGVASPSGGIEGKAFSAEEVRAICDEAANYGLRVAAHAHTRSGIHLAIENGVHDIQHISFLDDELAEMAHARGCTVTPTSWVLDEVLTSGGLPPASMEKARHVADAHRRAVDNARRGGLPILAGSDPFLPGMHGRNYMELVHLIKDGLSPREAWHSATGLAARAIAQEDTGTIAEGKRADLLFCKGNVIDDPRLLDASALLEVMKDGEGYRGFLEGIPQRTFATNLHAKLMAPTA